MERYKQEARKFGSSNKVPRTKGSLGHRTVCQDTKTLESQFPSQCLGILMTPSPNKHQQFESKNFKVVF